MGVMTVVMTVVTAVVTAGGRPGFPGAQGGLSVS
jgi:hypothetical protein